MKTPDGRTIDLNYFVEWRPYLWAPVVEQLLNSHDIAGRKVLEIGTRYGKMACLFALLGAEVTAIDLTGQDQSRAHAEAAKWNVQNKVHFQTYSGDLDEVGGGPFDIVFSKSVLVVVDPLDKLLGQIAARLSPDGVLMCAENLEANRLVNVVRQKLIHRSWEVATRFHPVNDKFMNELRSTFSVVERRDRFGMVTGISARSPRTTSV